MRRLVWINAVCKGISLGQQDWMGLDMILFSSSQIIEFDVISQISQEIREKISLGNLRQSN